MWEAKPVLKYLKYLHFFYSTLQFQVALHSTRNDASSRSWKPKPPSHFIAYLEGTWPLSNWYKRYQLPKSSVEDYTSVTEKAVEASWGADPLEFYGGFRSLEHDVHAKFPSSLAVNGSVGWSTLQVDSTMRETGSYEASLTFSFPDIDWTFLQRVYGWAALQYQGWARGCLSIHGDSPQSIVLYTDKLLEFWIDDKPYFGGDLYAYRKAPLVIRLNSGLHIIDLRFVRDLRAMGGVGDPSIQIRLKATISGGRLSIVKTGLIASDLIDGRLAGRLASVPVRNDGARAIEIVSVDSVDNAFSTNLLLAEPVRLVSGQSRPLAFSVTKDISQSLHLSLRISYRLEGATQTFSSSVISHSFTDRKKHEPHKITFIHPAGVVSYAILRAPSENRTCELTGRSTLPILINMHGAGLEADSEQVRHMLDSVPDLCAWVLYPTGGTPWSGDDWHAWGFADVEAAVKAIPDWVDSVSWRGPLADIDKWLVSGHSNGGQGVWYAITHRPDKIIGAAAVSGYTSVQAYVPYTFWVEADPAISVIVQKSLAEYRHELLVDNFAGIPILDQHGSADDNVPVFHSRRMVQLSAETDSPTGYVELPGKGHWYDGVMTTAPLREFYKGVLNSGSIIPRVPRCFFMVVTNPGDMGSRVGLVVDQLISPDQAGKIKVERDDSTSMWRVKTSNILRFHFDPSSNSLSPHHLKIDSCTLHVSSVHPRDECHSFVRRESGSWEDQDNCDWHSIEQRYGNQLGSIESMLRSRAPFEIVVPDPGTGTTSIALQISRNLFQYFRADSEILSTAAPKSDRGNRVSVELGENLSGGALKSHPITATRHVGITVRDSLGMKRGYAFEEGLGAIFLRPLPNERLEMVIWGYDIAGLYSAARLAPMITGVGQPDFVLVSRECAWKGVGGTLAMGFFDSFWNVSRASFLT